MQEIKEIRCTKCGKLLFRTHGIADDGALRFDKKVCLKSCEYTNGRILSIEIKCSHRIKVDGKNETCGTINRIEL